MKRRIFQYHQSLYYANLSVCAVHLAARAKYLWRVLIICGAHVYQVTMSYTIAATFRVSVSVFLLLYHPFVRLLSCLSVRLSRSSVRVFIGLFSARTLAASRVYLGNKALKFWEQSARTLHGYKKHGVFTS